MLDKSDENSPKYYGLACIVTDDMADVALSMGLRKFRTIEEIEEATVKTETYKQECL